MSIFLKNGHFLYNLEFCLNTTLLGPPQNSLISEMSYDKVLKRGSRVVLASFFVLLLHYARRKVQNRLLVYSEYPDTLPYWA